MEPLPAEPYRSTPELSPGPEGPGRERWPPSVYVAAPGTGARASSPDREEVVRVVEEALAGVLTEAPEAGEAGAETVETPEGKPADAETEARLEPPDAAAEEEPVDAEPEPVAAPDEDEPADETTGKAPPETLSDLLRPRLATVEETGALDVGAVLGTPELIEEVAEALAAEAAQRQADVVLALESRGFLLGIPVARTLGLPFVAVWREGRCPGEPLTVSRETADGRIGLEILRDALAPGRNVFLVDATVSSGETLAAAAELTEMAEAEVVGIGVLAARAAGGYEETLEGYNLLSLVEL